MIRGFLMFALLCSVGAIANVNIAMWLFQSHGVWWVGGPRGRAGRRRLELCGEQHLRLAPAAQTVSGGR